MNQLLTQREIDALLQGAETGAGESDSTQAVPYSFFPTRRLPREVRGTLEAIGTRYALALQGWLSLRLRIQSEVGLTAVEVVSVPEFLLSLPTPCAAFTFPISDRSGMHGVIDFGTEFASGLIDRVFGGSGDPPSAKRALTNLEQNVVRRLADRALELLGDAWPEPFQQSRRVLTFESDPTMLPISTAVEDVLVMILEVRAGASSGCLTFAAPVAVLEPFLKEKGSPRRSPLQGGTSGARASRSEIKAGLSTARVTLVARLPAFRLCTRAVSDLHEGQTVHTAHSVDTPIDVQINGCLLYRATIGQVRKRIALKIQESVSAPLSERPDSIKEGRVL